MHAFTEGTPVIPTTNTTAVRLLNCARGEGTTVSILHSFLEDRQCIALLVQEPWLDYTHLPPAHPDLILLSPTPTKPRCATYIKRIPGVTASTTFSHGDSFLGVEISIPLHTTSTPGTPTGPSKCPGQKHPFQQQVTSFTLYNFYSPGRPTHLHSLLKSGFIPSPNCILMGGLNTHHLWWAADAAS